LEKIKSTTTQANAVETKVSYGLRSDIFKDMWGAVLSAEPVKGLEVRWRTKAEAQVQIAGHVEELIEVVEELKSRSQYKQTMKSIKTLLSTEENIELTKQQCLHVKAIATPIILLGKKYESNDFNILDVEDDLNKLMDDLQDEEIKKRLPEGTEYNENIVKPVRQVSFAICWLCLLLMKLI